MTPKRIGQILLGLAMTSLIGVQIWYAYKQQAPEHVPQFSCLDLAKGCEVRLGDENLRLIADAAPGSLKSFHLTLRGSETQPTLRFFMKNMDIGPNETRPNQTAPTRWEADIMLPFCSRGRMDWVMDIQNDKARAQLHFTAGRANNQP